MTAGRLRTLTPRLAQLIHRHGDRSTITKVQSDRYSRQSADTLTLLPFLTHTEVTTFELIGAHVGPSGAASCLAPRRARPRRPAPQRASLGRGTSTSILAGVTLNSASSRPRGWSR